MKRYNVLATETDYAPAQRLSVDEALSQSDKIKKSSFLELVFSKIPLSFIIVNDYRQVVYSNKQLLNVLGYNALEDIVGYRPGEVFHCINAEFKEGGCGTDKHCRYCGAVNAMLESKKKNSQVEKELRLMTYTGGQASANDYTVSSTPFEWEGETFYMVTLTDISNLKRKEQIERVFFHDLLNKANSLDGLINILHDSSDEKQISRLKDYIQRGMYEMMQDIMFQREFYQAERGELAVTPTDLDCQTVLKNLQADFSPMLDYKNLTIIIDDNTEKFQVTTDRVLLNRVMTNLIKNAVEASGKDQTVAIGGANTVGGVKFWVQNNTVMPENIQMQIFNRSFSTKGTGRGIGTYSVKLFTEKYLQGKVSFTSTPQNGTTFYIELPRTLDFPKEIL